MATPTPIPTAEPVSRPEEVSVGEAPISTVVVPGANSSLAHCFLQPRKRIDQLTVLFGAFLSPNIVGWAADEGNAI